MRIEKEGIYLDIELLIKRFEHKVELKLCSNEYAKGYCFGVIDATIKDNDEYDRLSKIIDEKFNYLEDLNEI
ncbi:hypothetical protein [Clostridium sp. HBUAS56010]|uniref:hypothetical protein n=1 Tax=Clostridium sp. HBUAS56010 TaxID=2571127 RepID=UPI001177DA05|nr:hypothetical protein [Clostridium sp. HBUAS56010]